MAVGRPAIVAAGLAGDGGELGQLARRNGEAGGAGVGFAGHGGFWSTKRRSRKMRRLFATQLTLAFTHALVIGWSPRRIASHSCPHRFWPQPCPPRPPSPRAAWGAAVLQRTTLMSTPPSIL